MSGRPGFLFMLGVYGTRATRESVALLRETGACGVLLLARNIESPAQVRRLVDELQDRAGRALLFAVDHEGGWVLRFARGVTAFPGNAALGRAGDPAYAYATGRHMALELKTMGVRLNLAPVVDVLGKRYNPGIGIRSFGNDPALVGRLGAAMIRGLQDHGVSACAKHFPGKGAATRDAHVTLPTIRLPAREFYRRHLAPFGDAVRAGVHCVMTSHVRFPALDPSGAAATFSPRITGELLRGRLGFHGVVVSDDLCMGAVTQRLPIQRAALLALEAGHDLLLIAHEPRTQREACELLETAAARGDVSASRIAASVRRIRALMAGHRRAGADARPPTGGRALALLIARKAVELVQPGRVPLPLPLGDRGAPRVAALWPDFREVADRFTFEGGPRGPEERLRRRLSAWPARCSISLTPLLEGGTKAVAALRRARGADSVLLFCFEAMRFAGQRDVLRKAQAAFPGRLAICLIRNPRDRSLLRPGVTALDGHGYRHCTLDALLDALCPAALSGRPPGPI